MSSSLIGAAACSSNDVASPASVRGLTAASAFNTPVAGFNEVSSSFAPGDGSGMSPWMPDRMSGGPLGMAFGGFGGGDGGIGGPGMGGLMGGGMDGAFVGGESRGRGSERGPFAGGIDDTCVFAAGTGDVTCGPTTKNGITITRISTFKTAAGAAQSKPDSTTDFDRTRITVSGTTTQRSGVTSTISSSSDRTSTGLAYTSAKRTVNGKSAGSENSSGTNRDGVKFTSVRTSGDTTVGLVVPRPTSTTASTTPSYPTAGVVTRAMKVVMTLEGAAATTSTRREVVTYDGTATAKVTITQDGTTKSCTMPLPRGKLVCP
jgi:hypothetical protein